MSKQSRFIRSNWLAISILAVHLALGVFYSIVVPLWESYDEWGHYPYIEYIAEEHALPRARLTEHNDETHQPPLYYILGALATFWIDTSDDLERVENQYSVHGGGEGGMSFYLHLEDERFPYHGTVLAVHVTRLVSVLLSTATVWTTYLVARTLFPGKKALALGAMAINAFWPQFLFLGGVVNNDIMITTSASLVLLFLVRVLVGKPRPWDWFGLGLSLGAGLLSKRNGLALVPLVVVGLLVVVIREVRSGKGLVVSLSWILIVLAGVALILAWWLKGLRGRYQEHVLHISSLLSHPSQMAQLHWGRLPGALYFCLATFFAAFGHLTLGVEAWVYQIVALICLVACSGLIVFLVNRRSSASAKIGAAILVLHLLAILSAPTYRTFTRGGEPQAPTVVGSIQHGSPLLFSGNVFLLQGRFVLPAISSFSILLILGLASLVPDRFNKGLAVCVGLALFVFATLVPFRYILPAYARPSLLSPSQVKDLEYPLDITFGDKIKLAGYELESEDIAPGERAPVTLYWRCLSEMEQNHTLRVEILGHEAQVYGVLRLHPGQGNFPTSIWRRGDVFRDTYRVRISPDVPAPSLAQIKVSFHAPNSSEVGLKARDANGNPIGTTFGRLVIRQQDQPEIKNPVYYELGGRVALVGYEFNTNEAKGKVRVTLYWRALAEMEKDYTVFVHLIDEEGQLEAQDDSQPKGGVSPTRIWKAGEVIEDEHILSLSPNGAEERYHLIVGMYDLATMERLAAFDADGSRLLHDVIVLGEIRLSLVPFRGRLACCLANLCEAGGDFH